MIYTERKRERERGREREREREIHLTIVHETHSIPSYKVVIQISPVILNMEKNHDDTYWTLLIGQIQTSIWLTR